MSHFCSDQRIQNETNKMAKNMYNMVLIQLTLLFKMAKWFFFKCPIHGNTDNFTELLEIMYKCVYVYNGPNI